MSRATADQTADRTVGWGIVAPGKIAGSFARDLALVPGAALTSVCSRSPERAAAFAREHGSERTSIHTDAAALAADPAVDVVYVASPHTLHPAHAAAAIAAGKPVLCEKPLTINADSASELIAAAEGAGVFLMEAMWTACNPVVRAVRDGLGAGRFGEPRQLHADLGFRVDTLASRRVTDPALGAGALLDMGIYPLTVADLLLGPAEDVVAVASLRDGVDWDIALATRHAGGGLGALTASMTSWSPRTASLATSEGLLLLPKSFHHPDHATWLPHDGEPEEIAGVEPLIGTGLGNEALEVQRCLAAGRLQSDLVPHARTLRVLELMDTARAHIGVSYPGEA